MSDRTSASVLVIGGGVTGLSTAWWLARSGVDVAVLDKGIVGWEASGRNGGGATHVFSPFFREEQRLWPQMDEMLGYPTEYQRHRIRIALNDVQAERMGRLAKMAQDQGFTCRKLDRKELQELVPLVGDNPSGGLFLGFGVQANPRRNAPADGGALQYLGRRIAPRSTVRGA